ncbi:helix-turn-helix domain-containing protein [Pseudomonas neustonica]|uniref:XRE family transcriptional regulator n=1 Tax=Pseudomonas neustonica TaxID=2487346 RepID=A0ABX9XHN6_9PSED|nr:MULTISPECIES: helix-turn-helix transcriptional regulator [Pseudomonas]ROZ84212.1 XRE family transcriptional regulator [Pseudomonas sp. SSM44]ROZ84459.1 XRE family transcriptional regulator [Pseudomonas neustonica]|tara:strand:+ start:810 stop:1070 length:261 start_codon:yes stop_codon:yes gene_type:complete
MVSSIHRDEYVVLLRLLRQYRVESGLTQGQFAQALERPQSFVSDMERGFRRIDLIQLRDICEVLNISLLDFVSRFEAELSAPNQSR